MKPAEISTELTPGQTTQIDRKRKEIVDFIRHNCTTAIETYRHTGKPLYRGINGLKQTVHQPAFIGQSSKNRQPMDISMRTQKRIDRVLRGAGFKALRGNSIFCTSSKYMADVYKRNGGSIYMIFPIDGFDFTWSTDIGDLYKDMHFKLVKWLHTGVPEYLEGMERFGQDDDLADLSYFLQMLDGEGHLTPNEFASEFGFTHDDFAAAVSSGNEVLIHGNYVAVDEKARMLKFKDIVI